MRDIKTKNKVSRSTKTIERKEKIKLLNHSFVKQTKARVKNKQEDYSNNYATNKITDSGKKAAGDLLKHTYRRKQKYKMIISEETHHVNKDVHDEKQEITISEKPYHGKSRKHNHKSKVKKENKLIQTKETRIGRRNGQKHLIKLGEHLPKQGSKLHNRSTPSESQSQHIQNARSGFIKQRVDIFKEKAYKKASPSKLKYGTINTIKKSVKTIFNLHKVISMGLFGITVIVLIFFISIFAVFSDDSPVETSMLPLSPEVENYREVIEKYAEKYAMKQYIPLIRAVMMQESGGKGNDPMQASECQYNEKYPKEPNSITDPEYSIEVGIHYLSECLKKANVKNSSDIEMLSLALQGYNYGNGYIDWALHNFGKYTKANATVYSDEMKAKLKTDVYGDPDYVSHVMRYYNIGKGEVVQIALSQVGNVGGKPYWSWYGYPNRVEWCACFVSWVMNEAGILDQGLAPKFSNCQMGIQWFRQKKQWHSKNTIPNSGYIIFFDFNMDGTSDHVGIVEKVEENVIYTIEGNSVGDECRQQTYPVQSQYIVGYGGISK